IAYDGALSMCVKDHHFSPNGSNAALTACIRMERADYCGDGTSHTYGGTNIDVYPAPDDKPARGNKTDGDPKQWDDCADGRCFEDTWDEKGAICVAPSRWVDLPFDPTKCGSGKFGHTYAAKNPDNGVDDGAGNKLIYCRNNKPSATNHITRSRTQKCGDDSV